MHLSLGMAMGRGGFKHPIPAPASMHPSPNYIRVKIEHPTPPLMETGLPAPPPPAKTLFFIKYLKNTYFFIATKNNNYINN